jgi:hypothetical protein
MSGWNRAVMTLVAAGVAGFLLWLAAQFDMHTSGGYWAAMGVVAGCGLLLGIAQLRGSGGNPKAMVMLAFLPVFVCTSWILLYAQPHSEWGRHLIRSWSGHLGIDNVVNDIATWNGVVAFGLGLVCAAVLEPRMMPLRRRSVATTPAYEPAAADEPVAAEREEVTTSDPQPVEHTRTVVR